MSIGVAQCHATCLGKYQRIGVAYTGFLQVKRLRTKGHVRPLLYILRVEDKTLHTHIGLIENLGMDKFDIGCERITVDATYPERVDVDELIKNKEFSNLKGLIYFTDGFGEREIPKPKTYRNLWVVFDDERHLSLKDAAL